MLMAIYECIFIYIYILSLVVLSPKLYMYLFDFTKEKLYIGVFRVYCERIGSWFLMKGAPPPQASYMGKLCTASYFSTFGMESLKWSVVCTST